jgi:hypothetical protein
MSRTDTSSTESSSGGLTLQDIRDEQPRSLQAGDAAFRGRDPRRLYFVVGEFPNSDLELASAKQIEEKTIRVDEFGDILDAIDHGRLVTYRASGDELTPFPKALDTPDIDEVRR